MFRKRGYPLSALFVTITACTVGVTMWSVSAQSNWSAQQLAIATIGMFFVGGFVGGKIGLFHYRRRRGYLLGWMAGGVIGIFMGPLLLSDQRGLESLLVAQLGGGILVLLTTIAVHFLGTAGGDQHTAASRTTAAVTERARYFPPSGATRDENPGNGAS